MNKKRKKYYLYGYYTHQKLAQKTKNTKKTIEWMQENNFLPKEKFCVRCPEKRMVLENYKKGKRWICSNCTRACSIFANTIFFKNRLSLPKLLDLGYFWCLDLSQATAKKEIESKSDKPSFECYRKLQKLAFVIMKEESPRKIGGFGHVVEIDESKFSKRNYNVGRAVRSPWVVGGIDTPTNHTFFVEVIIWKEIR